MILSFFSQYITPYLLFLLGVMPVYSYNSGPILGEENCHQSFLPQNIEKSLPQLISAPPEISSSSAAVLAVDANFWLYEKSAQEKRSIASITKLMTTLVFLDTQPNWEENYTIVREDGISGGRLHLFLGDTLTIKQLFYTALISSDNGAVTALVRSTGLSQDEFILKMNKKAQDLSLFSTSFSDVTGLSDNNISTAKDVIRLAKIALNTLEIEEALKLENYRYITKEGREKIILSTANGFLADNGNNLVVIGGKTGYTEKAGYCFVGRYFDETGREVISVVLGANNRHDRFVEANKLASWAFFNCDW
jgi:D-alanyl-D-alanine carboxypeptidase